MRFGPTRLRPKVRGIHLSNQDNLCELRYELWFRYQQGQGLSGAIANARLVPDFYNPKKIGRYYQRIAIDRSIEAILKGQKRCLLTMATGTGKTAVAFQICWKLWSAGWNTSGDPTRKPRILFLTDRNVLVDDPKDKDFAPFGEARMKIEDPTKGRSTNTVELSQTASTKPKTSSASYPYRHVPMQLLGI